MADDLDKILDLYGTTSAPSRSTPSPKAPSQDLESLLNIYGPATAPAPAAPKKTKSYENNPNDTMGTSALKGGATAIVKGLSHIPGFVNDVGNFSDYLFARGVSAATGRPIEQVYQEMSQRQAAARSNPTAIGQITNAMNPREILPTSEGVQNKIFQYTGEYKPETGLGAMGMAGVEAIIGSAAPGMIRAPAPVPMNPAQTAFAAAPVTGTMGAVGQGATDATGDPLIGVAAGMGVPAAGAVARGVGRLAIGTLPPERAQLAQAAVNQGIPLGIGDLSNRLPVRFAGSVAERMPFSGAGPFREAQQQAFNRAVGRTFGEDSPVINRQVMAQARDRIGADFDLVAANTRIIPDQPLARDFANVVRQAQLGSQGAETQVLRNIQEIGNRIQRQGGVIDGRTYQDLTRTGDPSSGRGAGLVQRLMRDNDPYVREAGQGLRNALDDALQRNAPPDMVPVLQQARQQYRNMRTIEDLVAKNPEGDLSPALLQGRVNAKNKGTRGRAYGGGGQLGELADIGQAFLKQPPSSGTPERMFWMNMLPTMAGGGLAVGTGNPWHGVAGAALPAATMGAGRIANNVLTNPNLGNALINRSLGIAPVVPNNQVGFVPMPYLPPQPLAPQ